MVSAYITWNSTKCDTDDERNNTKNAKSFSVTDTLYIIPQKKNNTWKEWLTFLMEGLKIKLVLTPLSKSKGTNILVENRDLLQHGKPNMERCEHNM